MSFYDDPVVDDNAKRSQESVHFVKGLFSHKNGFIYRDEIPDYGVDLDVELILKGTGASSEKFPIQIKSAVHVKKVQSNNEELISFEFKTSRLGYLAKRPPAYGIFALYDDTEQICYFDYVDDIISRLDENPARDGWREQEHVNILLPVQVLDAAILPILHNRFITRHQNSHLMLQEHGQKFNIPSLGEKQAQQSLKIDFKDPVQVADFLEKSGILLYNEAAFAMLNQLLGVVSRERLNNSPRLIFLAALTYTQTGHIIDAEYYLRKAKRTPEVMQGEGTSMIEFAAARLEFLKGNIDHAFFIEKFKEIAARTETPANKLNIQINILFFELMKGMETGVFPPDYEARIAALRQEIEAANLPEDTKQLLRCHHTDSQFHFALRNQMKLYAEIKSRDDQQNPMPMDERTSRIKHYASLIDEADQTLYEAYVYGRDNDDDLLRASGAHQMGQHFFALRSSILFLREEDKVPQDKAKLVEVYERNQNFSLIAYNQFLKLNMFQNAHEALCMAYDINQLCIHLTGVAVGQKTVSELMTIIREIEEAFELTPFQSRMDEFTKALAKSTGRSGKPMRDQSDEEITEMASMVLARFNLPLDRLSNVIHDMKMVRKFEQEVTNPAIVMGQDMQHTRNKATHYASLPMYFLKHQKLGIETKPSSDIDWLLSQFSTILKKDDE